MTAKIKINVSDLTPQAQVIKEIREKYGARKLEIQVDLPNKLEHLEAPLFWEVITELNDECK